MTKKKGLLIIGVALLLAGAGVVYAHWQDTLTMDVDVMTGTIDPQWSLAGTNDDGVDDGWDGEVVPSTVFTFGDPTSNDPAGPFGSAGEIIRVTTGTFYFSDTGWAGWSCPPGTYPVAGSDGEGHAMQVSKAAVPSDPQYPVYPHYTYTPPEVGWVWQSAADGIGTPEGLVLWVDCQEVPENPRYDKDVADCFAALEADGAEDPNDWLSVAIDNAYPSYWCTVKADLHNTGSVPVKLQSIAMTGGDADIEIMFADTEEIFSCGYQLDPGPQVDFYVSFHPLNPVDQGATYEYDLDLTWVNYNEFDPAACSTPFNG